MFTYASRLFPLLLAILLVLSACSGNASHGTTYRVDASLRAFYTALGGQELLGPAISRAFAYNEAQCQYTINVLLCRDEQGNTLLAPLGANLAAGQATAQQAASSTSLVVNGIPVYEEFIPLYKQFSGASVVGYPLGQAQMNYSQQRIEQYFQNIGFYRNFSDKAGDVKLLAYGAAACIDRCNYSPAVDATISSTTVPETDRIFLAGLEKLGDATIFGAPLTRAFLAADGMQEQVFQNAALYTAPGSNVIHLRSVPVIIGMPAAEPGAKLYSNQQGMVFYATSGSLGYHVPQIFDDFIAAHGGTSISGMPIAEVTEVSTGVYRQCFQNYCLVYTPAADTKQQFTLEATGSAYLAKISPADLNGETVVLSPSTVALRLAEQFSLLQPDQSQQITITLRSQVNDQPLAGIGASLQITLPKDKSYSAELPATLADGSSSITVPYLKEFPNGTIVHYQICLTGIIAEPVCAKGSYIQMNLP